MLTTLALGVVSSLVAEFISWVNKKLAGTPLRGDGAFLTAAFISLVVAGTKLYMAHQLSITSWTDLAVLGTAFSQVWAVSQVVFLGVIQMFNLDVKPVPNQ